MWTLYRRNHKGAVPPRKTRKTCIVRANNIIYLIDCNNNNLIVLLQRQGMISTGNPCPICRDEYLVFDHRNVDLLKQFISEFNGAVISYQ